MHRAPEPKAITRQAKCREQRVRIRRVEPSRCGSPACGFRDGLNNLHVASAAAKIAGKPFANFIGRGLGFFAQQVVGSEDHSWSADAALRTAAIEKSLLQDLRAAVRGQTLDRNDAGAIHLKCRY